MWRRRKAFIQGLARFSTQRKKEVRAAEGGNDGVTLKKKKKIPL